MRIVLMAFIGLSCTAARAQTQTNNLWPVIPALPIPAPAAASNSPAFTAATIGPPAPVVATRSGYVADDKYKLRAGDKVSLQIIEDRDAPKSLVVADSGELDIPYIGRVAAAEKTCKQIAGELKALLEKEYYYRATVVLALDVANKFLGRIYVW